MEQISTPQAEQAIINTAEQRIDLEAGYFDRNKVKNLGAKWDGYTWYIDEGAPLEPFYDYLPPQEQQKIDLAKSEREAKERGIKGDTVDRANFRESGQAYLEGIRDTLVEQGYTAKDIEIRDYGLFQKLDRGREEITLHLSQNSDQTAAYRVSISNRDTLKNAYSPWQNAEVTDKDAAIEKTLSYIAEKSPILATKRTQKTTQEATQENAAQERQYIDVSYSERFEAKNLGAKWDKDQKSWYIPEGVDTTPFAKWQAEKPTQKQTAQKPAEQTASAAKERQYIDVPFAEKNAAKELGARWDKDQKSWYIPEGVDTAPFAKWMPEVVQKETTDKAAPVQPSKPVMDEKTTASPEIRPATSSISTDPKFWEDFYQRYDEAQITATIAERYPTYIAVEYDQRDQAKELGAKWDKDNKSWYIPAGVDKPELHQFLPEKVAPVAAEGKTLADFQRAAQDIGLNIRELSNTAGVWHRVSVEGRSPSMKDGAYKLYHNADGTIGGIARNLATGQEITWSNRGNKEQNVSSAITTARQLNQAVQKEIYQEMRNTVSHLRGVDANLLYQQLPPARGDEPYLANKGMQYHNGIKRLEDGSIVLPLISGERVGGMADQHVGISSLQVISPNGDKKLMTQAQKNGAYFPLGDNRQTPSHVILAEGVATAEAALQISQQRFGSNVLAIAAIDSSNLAAVAEKINIMYPQAEKIIAADNDRATAEKIGKNPGVAAAENVARQHPEYRIATPPLLDGKNTDWNDYLKKEGIQEAVKHFQTEMLSKEGKTEHSPKPAEQAPAAAKKLELNIDGLCAREIGKAAYKAIDGDIRNLPALSQALAEKGYKLDEKAIKAAAGHEVTLKDAFTKAVSKASEKTKPASQSKKKEPAVEMAR